ncbi:hypothetical protein [Jeongeupia sp. HS-3]|uniref:hypothetical protein n=1 Tax=Jeongeupia sp. HS-3 TaxID=1009682 RepID=UPI0019108309|nr:hypothetical protein [Jeongeupia sp. HS-3]
MDANEAENHRCADGQSQIAADSRQAGLGRNVAGKQLWAGGVADPARQISAGGGC